MKTFVLAFAVLGLAGPALAQQAPDFDKTDTDRNGAISAAEMKVAMPAMTTDQWNMADADKSNALSRTEFEAMIKSGM